MYGQQWFPQDKSCGAIGQTLLGITKLSELGGYNRFRAGVAYATYRGCDVLNEKLRRLPLWRKADKRWLISIDYGRSEPKALGFLADLTKSEVRIPKGLQVVAAGGFVPLVPFHPKAYAVDNIADGPKNMFGCFLGSGNLTGSGLLTGSECGVLSFWSDPTDAQEKAMLNAYESMAWFDSVWEAATPLSHIIKPYAKLWKKSKPPIVEENEALVDLYSGGPDNIVSGALALSLASANGLWVEVHELYKNRGKYEAGNQVDTPRGTRVFFGFSPANVHKDTVLGQVVLQVKGFAAVPCSVRFGNNSMDKINLPVPGVDGPATYDNTFLRFSRAGADANGLPKFQLTVGSAADLKKWKAASVREEEKTMQSGRRYGVLF